MSRNTSLKTLNLIDVVPGVCPPNYLASVVSKVSSSELETLNIRFYIYNKEQMGLDYFDFKALGEVLCPAGFPKFPQLRTLTFCLSMNKTQEKKVHLDATELRRKVFKEMPFLRAWQNGFGLSVNIPTVYLAL